MTQWLLCGQKLTSTADTTEVAIPAKLDKWWIKRSYTWKKDASATRTHLWKAHLIHLRSQDYIETSPKIALIQDQSPISFGAFLQPCTWPANENQEGTTSKCGLGGLIIYTYAKAKTSQHGWKSKKNTHMELSKNNMQITHPKMDGL